MPNTVDNSDILLDLTCHRDWIGRIFNIFYPALNCFGGIHNLNVTSIPEVSNAFAVLRRWCLELLYGRHRRDDEQGLLTKAYQVVKLCFYIDKQNTLEPIKRSPLLDIFRRLPLFQRPNGESSVCFVDELFYSVSTVNITAVARGVLSVKWAWSWHLLFWRTDGFIKISIDVFWMHVFLLTPMPYSEPSNFCADQSYLSEKNSTFTTSLFRTVGWTTFFGFWISRI